MYRFGNLCQQFGSILGGKGNQEDNICSVNFQRQFPVKLFGQPIKHLDEIEVWFQMLQDGNALNFGEVAVFQEELAGFTTLLIQQKLVVSAIHNHWIFTVPEILYVHIQSMEPPLQFAKKLKYAFSALRNYPPVSS